MGPRRRVAAATAQSAIAPRTGKVQFGPVSVSSLQVEVEGMPPVPAGTVSGTDGAPRAPSFA